MAEIRKHNPSGNEMAEAVRAALGDDIRPIPPGSERTPTSETYDPFDVGERAVADPDAPVTFAAAVDPLIGAMPPDLASWWVVPEDEQ